MLRVTIVCVLLAGCASLTEGDCRTAGLPPRIDQYAAQCSARVADATYMEGWQVGYTEWNRRVSGSKM
jgi:hypothetical protein